MTRMESIRRLKRILVDILEELPDNQVGKSKLVSYQRLCNCCWDHTDVDRKVSPPQKEWVVGLFRMIKMFS